jgi:bacteriocin-like protein
MEQDEDEVKVEDMIPRESEDELSDEKLSSVTGGAGPTETVSFPYGHIEW